MANVGYFNTVQLQDYLGGFLLRNSATGALTGVTFNNLTNSLANPGEGTRFNVMKYETPTFAGFTASASWGEDDVWDAALRCVGEFNCIKLAAGIGYAEWTDNERGYVNIGGQSGVNGDELGMSASIMQVPTGLFLSGAYGQRNDDNRGTPGITGNR